MSGSRRPVVLGPDDGRTLSAGPNQVTLKITSAHTDRFSLLDCRVGPRFAAPPVLHAHSREDWIAVVTAGEITFSFDDGDIAAPAGTTVFVPHGVPFAWRNDHDHPARYLAFHAPSGFEQFFADLADAIGGREAPTPQLMAEVIPPLWQEYGLYPAGREDGG